MAANWKHQRVMSEEREVIPGVPQGTVLASILFIIIILDADENLRWNKSICHYKNIQRYRAAATRS